MAVRRKVNKGWTSSIINYNSSYVGRTEDLCEEQQREAEMPFMESPLLESDEIDDLLYFARINETNDLEQTIQELSQKYSCSRGAIFSAGIDPETGNNVLHYCSANGLTDLLKVLLAQLGVRLDSNSTTAKQREIILVNRTNKQGNTPLHWAAYNGHLEIVKMLLAAGADLWVKNSAGHLAMFEAERAEKSEVVQYLLETGGERVERSGLETTPPARDDGDVNGEVALVSGGFTNISIMEAGPSG